MNKKGNLFKLIQSLSKPEKRYFKRFASLHGKKSNYITLFDAIECQSEYDEAAIKTRFKDQTFVKQLHVTKINLTKLILKSLRNFHSDLSIDTTLKDLLRNIEILFSKELYESCYHAIEKATTLAIKYEKLPALLELTIWKRKLLFAVEGQNRAKAKINKLLEMDCETIEKLEECNRYWEATLNMFDWVGDPEKIENNPFVAGTTQASTLQSQTLKQHIGYAMAIMVTHSPQEATDQLNELIELWEANPHRIKDEPGSYITALQNKTAAMIYRRELEDVPAMLAKIKSIPSKYGLKSDNPITLKLFLKSYNFELEMYRDTGQFDKGVAMESEVSEFLEKRKGKIPIEYEILLSYQFAYLNFMAGNFSQALKWNRNLMYENAGLGREDLLLYSRLLNLMIHFELQHFSVLRYSVTSTRRFFRKKRNLEPFVKILLRFFSNVCTQHPEKHSGLMLKLKDELADSIQPEEMQNTLDYFDFIAWIEGRTTPKNQAH